MKPIYKAWLCQIDINNSCSQFCAYCSRYIRHLRPDQRFNMSVSIFRKAILSLREWPGKIGVIGGEPTFHPRFEDICLILKKLRIPRHKLELFTSGGVKFERHKKLINEVFGHIAYNEHSEKQREICLFQPSTIAIDDVVSDEGYRKELIDKCWLQRTWCPTINPKGCFFCEVAGALDILLDGPGGYPIEPDWWKKEPKDFQDQVERYCKHCGIAIPLKRELLSVTKEKFSPGLLKIFKEHNLRNLSDEYITLFDRHLTIKEMEKTKETWDPANNRQDLRPDIKQGWRERYKEWYK